MTDLTPFFQQCVDIYNESNDPISSHKPKEGPITIDDTFNRECKELFKEIKDFKKLIDSIKPSYLLSNLVIHDDYEDDEILEKEIENDEFEDENNKSKIEFTEEDRDLFDSQSNLMLHKFSQKLNFLENYETKRFENFWFNENFNKISTKENKLSIFKKYMEFNFKKNQFELINNNYHDNRKGILSIISVNLKKVTNELVDLQNIRLNRKLEEKSNELHVLNNEDLSVESKNNDPDLNLSFNQQLHIDDDSNEDLEIYNQTLSKLPPKQLQQLQSENHELLNSKLNELNKVKTLQRSTIEISNLQRELSLHVETQAEKINYLLQDEESAEVDILKGNRELKSAKERGNKASKLIFYISILLGIFLLIFDSVII